MGAGPNLRDVLIRRPTATKSDISVEIVLCPQLTQHLRATAQQSFDTAMDQHRDIGLDPRCPLKFRAFADIDNFDKLARHMRLGRQKLDLRIGIGIEAH
jgi:hypothetical protein